MALPKCLDDPGTIRTQKMCLNAISMNLKGNLVPKDKERQPCEKPQCLTLKTVHALHGKVQPTPCNSELGKKIAGEFSVERLVTAYEGNGNGRGFHAGDFEWTAGSIVIAGRISGMTNVGTHREPVFEACQKCDTKGVMEGRLCGQVIKEAIIPELKGCLMVGSYRIKFKPSVEGGAGQMISAVIEAVLICPCK